MTDKTLAPCPDLASDSLIERLSEMTREHVKNLQADPDLAAKLDSDPLAQRAYAEELFNGTRKEIDLRARKFDLCVDVHPGAPLHMRWSCIDLNTYDGGDDSEAPATFIGRGASEKEARMALLDLFSEHDGEEPRPRPPVRVSGHNPFSPPEVIEGTREDWAHDDE